MNKRLTVSALLVILYLLSFPTAYAQLTTPPGGGNKKASIAERVGLTDVAIHYDRPGVKGREGQIWGKLITPGFTDLGFGTSKAAPWRAGANENTTIEFSTDVKIEGQDLPAGKYGFFIAYDPSECTLIFSKNSSSWGSFFYDPKEDILQVKVKPQPLSNSVEWLKYEFLDQKESSATIALEWEKLMIPFTVNTDLVQLQLASFRRELRSDKGFPGTPGTRPPNSASSIIPTWTKRWHGPIRLSAAPSSGKRISRPSPPRRRSSPSRERKKRQTP